MHRFMQIKIATLITFQESIHPRRHCPGACYQNYGSCKQLSSDCFVLISSCCLCCRATGCRRLKGRFRRSFNGGRLIALRRVRLESSGQQRRVVSRSCCVRSPAVPTPRLRWIKIRGLIFKSFTKRLVAGSSERRQPTMRLAVCWKQAAFQGRMCAKPRTSSYHNILFARCSLSTPTLQSFVEEKTMIVLMETVRRVLCPPLHTLVDKTLLRAEVILN